MGILAISTAASTEAAYRAEVLKVFNGCSAYGLWPGQCRLCW